MTTKDLFQKNPLTWTLANEGVSSNNDASEPTLRWEVETFVCDGEYEVAMEKILRGYLDRFGKEQAGAWISGFYGSGKSHLVKVLRYLWVNHQFSDGSRAREIASLPTGITDLLKELSTLARQHAGLHAAGGTLKAGSGDVRMRILQIVFQSVGLPENFVEARFLMDLRDEGHLEDLEGKIRERGKNPTDEIKKMYVSKALQESYLEICPHHGSVESVGKALREQYPAKPASLTIDDMIAGIRRAISRDGKLPCTLLVLDEIQQFINNSADVSLDVQEVVEACQSKLDGRVIVVGTGQSALTDVPALQRLMGRFPIKRHLKDNDVEKVLRTVVLQKKPEHKATVNQLVAKHSGEITRQLKDTRIATQPGDVDRYAPDFPLLPVRQRFWKHVLQHTDPSGTSAQMRTQLRVTHEACRFVADRPLGAVIPADFIYDQLASDLLIAGELQKRFQEIIEDQAGKPQGDLRRRLCSTVFLVNKLPDETKLGIAANAEHLADLLSDDLIEGSEALRKVIPDLLTALHEEGVLMEVEGEYRLQTTEGATWESEFRKKLASIKNDEAQVAAERSRLLHTELRGQLGGISVQQGEAKVPRKALVHFGSTAPDEHDGPVIWVRDGYAESESAVLKEINGAPVTEATVYVLVPRNQERLDDLKAALAAKLAATETINAMGTPANDAARDAQQGIKSRQQSAEGRVTTLIAQIISDARVFLAGGDEKPIIALKEGAEDAVTQVIDRLYPRFSVADSSKWDKVWKQAKEGNPSALQSLGYQGDPDRHPVAKEILLHIGSQKKGADIVKHFTGGDYGWPKDAVDATLAVLVVSGHLGAEIDFKRAGIKDLDQRSIGKATFKVERPILSAAEKLKVKKLFKALDQPVTPGDEATAAKEFVTRLKALADSTGGEAPAPERPHPPKLAEMAGLSGNELLHRLFHEEATLTVEIENWTATAKKLQARLPDFQLAASLVATGREAGLSGMEDLAADLEAIRQQRSLLDDPDPAATVLKSAETTLRAALQAAHERHGQTLAAGLAQLQAHPAWGALPADQRESLLARHSLAPRPQPAMDSAAALRDSLAACSLATWQSHTDAIATRCQAALAEAIQASEPKAKRVSLPGATIKSEAELEVWIGEVRAKIGEALKDGPAIV